MKIIRVFWFLIFLGAVTLALTKSTVVIATPEDKAHLYTRTIEFDYLGWTLNAVGIKTGEAGIDVNEKLTLFQKHQVVVRYFGLVRQLETVTGKVQAVYSDPSVKDPQLTAKDDLVEQEVLQATLGRLDPIVEDILQQQVADTVIKLGIARIGEVLPPVLYHTSATPKSLITSPRNKIEQDVSISLMADLTLAETTQLETQVEEKTGESALVVGTGGIGVYPTMVMRTSDLPWVVNTIAHEWTHNYLTMRSLGLNYDTTPELRIMNETTASIAGNEIGAFVLKTYYPELSVNVERSTKAAAPVEADSFNFQAEMHQTRVTVDDLLAQGKVDEAQQYMEQRRQVFVDHGYLIRKLNQAYFAFYGAYADSPVSAAGEDPVGEAVRELRTNSPTLAVFLRKIAWMNSYEDLKKAVGK